MATNYYAMQSVLISQSGNNTWVDNDSNWLDWGDGNHPDVILNAGTRTIGIDQNIVVDSLIKNGSGGFIINTGGTYSITGNIVHSYNGTGAVLSLNAPSTLTLLGNLTGGASTNRAGVNINAAANGSTITVGSANSPKTVTGGLNITSANTILVVYGDIISTGSARGIQFTGAGLVNMNVTIRGDKIEARSSAAAFYAATTATGVIDIQVNTLNASNVNNAGYACMFGGQPGLLDVTISGPIVNSVRGDCTIGNSALCWAIWSNVSTGVKFYGNLSVGSSGAMPNYGSVILMRPIAMFKALDQNSAYINLCRQLPAEQILKEQVMGDVTGTLSPYKVIQ